MPKILRNHHLIFKDYFGQVVQMPKFCSASNSSPFLFYSIFSILNISSILLQLDQLNQGGGAHHAHSSGCLTALIHKTGCRLHRLSAFLVCQASYIPSLFDGHPASTERYGHYCLKAQCTPEVPLFLLRPLVGRGGSHSLHPKQDYSADLNLAPAHPSFKRRTNSY